MATLTSQQVMERLDIHKNTLLRWVADDEIPLTGQLLSSRFRVFTEAEVEAFELWMKEHPERFRPGRRPANPQTETVTLPDGTKKRRMRSKSEREGSANE